MAAEQAKWVEGQPQSSHQDIAAVLEHERAAWEEEKGEQMRAVEVHWQRQMKEMETDLQGQII